MSIQRRMKPTDFLRKFFSRPQGFGDPCAYGFRDLFRAAEGRDMTQDEATRLFALSQAEVNQWVEDAVRKANKRTPNAREKFATHRVLDPRDNVLYVQFSRPGHGYDFTRDEDIIIRSKIAPGHGRLDYEDLLLSPVKSGIEGWHRSHSQGQGTGYESSVAITYAPPDVNLKVMGAVEDFIHDIYGQKASDVDLYLETATRCHRGSLRLSRIEYRLDAVRNGRPTSLFEAVITVTDDMSNPRVDVEAGGRADIDQFLKPLTPAEKARKGHAH